MSVGMRFDFALATQVPWRGSGEQDFSCCYCCLGDFGSMGPAVPNHSYQGNPEVFKEGLQVDRPKYHKNIFASQSLIYRRPPILRRTNLAALCPGAQHLHHRHSSSPPSRSSASAKNPKRGRMSVKSRGQFGVNLAFTRMKRRFLQFFCYWS